MKITKPITHKPISAQWLQDLTDFNTFITVTERKGMTSLRDLASKLLPFYQRNLPDATIFTAFEPHANDIGYHAHSMARLPDDRIDALRLNVNNGKTTYCTKLWKKLHRQFGRSTISPIKDHEHVANYCKKRAFNYTVKDQRAVYNIFFGTGKECRRDWLQSRKNGSVVYPML